MTQDLFLDLIGITKTITDYKIDGDESMEEDVAIVEEDEEQDDS
jgi:hypothetical protein